MQLWGFNITILDNIPSLGCRLQGCILFDSLLCNPSRSWGFFVLLTRASIGFRSDLKELVIGSNIKVEHCAQNESLSAASGCLHKEFYSGLSVHKI